MSEKNNSELNQNSVPPVQPPPPAESSQPIIIQNVPAPVPGQPLPDVYVQPVGQPQPVVGQPIYVQVPNTYPPQSTQYYPVPTTSDSTEPLLPPPYSEKPIQNGPFKVFFIASNQSSLDDKLNYSLKKGEKANFQKVVANTTKFKREEFSVYVFCFDIIKEELREVDRDKEKKLYKAIIKLNKKKKLLKGSNYEGKIFFKETQNNFIYDFEFEEEKGFIGNSQPPLAVKFTKTEQLKLFNLALTKLKIKQNWIAAQIYFVIVALNLGLQ